MMKKIFLFVAMGLSFLPFFVVAPAFAQDTDHPPVDVGNPLTGYQQSDDTQQAGIPFVQSRIANLLRLMLQILVVASLLPVVYGGILMITANGNSEGVEKGKASIFWGVVGLTLAFMAILLYSLLLRILLGTGTT